MKNLFNKQRTHKNWVNYKIQQNHCVNLLRKTKKNYFTHLNIKLLVKHSGKELNQILMRKVPVLVKLYFQKKGLFSMTIRKFVIKGTITS